MVPGAGEVPDEAGSLQVEPPVRNQASDRDGAVAPAQPARDVEGLRLLDPLFVDLDAEPRPSGSAIAPSAFRGGPW